MKMGKKVREYKSGDFIFAKVKGYPAWPARVQKQNGKKYFVYFYGTGETANLPPNMIFDYAENKDKFLNKSVKRKDFNDGVKQIEHDFTNNVPLEQVIGALAEAEPAPADDSMNETANNTADSAIDTTAADETMDEVTSALHCPVDHFTPGSLHAVGRPAPADDSMNETANDTADSAIDTTAADETMDEVTSALHCPVDHFTPGSLHAVGRPAPADDSMNETANDTADSAIDTTAADETMDEVTSALHCPVDHFTPGSLHAVGRPAPADDSMNETANDTADSAIDTTAADETMDESAIDGPVEDSDDAGALVIDEGKQKGRKSSVKPAATPKAKEPKTPRGRAKKDDKEDEEEKKDEEIVSRSGRKIKPGKRYIDEQTDDATLPSPAPKKRRGASPVAEKDKEVKEKPQDRNIKAYNTVQQSELRELKEPFKSADPEKENILIAYLPSGQYCGVKLFQSRPASFKSEASRLQWDKQAASNAITLKKQLEKGQITPQSISAQLVMDLNLTDDERQALDRDRDLEVKKSRLHFLKTEMKLIELDAKIKTCLSLEKADTELCLKLIDEILELDLAALMLLKHPTCMETVKRMRVYVGNAPSWEMSEAEALTFSKQAHRIRNKADALFITMRDLFHVPEGVSFWELFNERVAQFKAATENLHADKLLEMVHEPIELSQPIAHTMKAAVDAANDQEAESDDADKKKKPTPAKGKKPNSTPLKQPLKRGRKPAQEEKEKEKQENNAEETDTNKPNENDKGDSEEPKENNENEKANEAEKANDDAADKEVEKVNENSENHDKEDEEKGEGDSEKAKDDTKKESNKEKGDVSKTNDNDDKTKDDDKTELESDKDESKKSKESEKNSDKSKDNKNKEKGKEEAKNGKDKGPKGDKRKEKGSEKEQSVEKEKVDVDEPRAKRSRESKKTEPPPRSPAKRKSRS
ncbi:hepatoma-derived growth factor-related protein 2 [Cydia amplana]|uniref:hepatoma-derived growth factor-related protein 2 n=1 Tax=Cydia amplana TaxID=1869771 RepID=UPI002FE51264